MDYLFDDVYDDSFDLGMESYIDIDDDYALEDASTRHLARGGKIKTNVTASREPMTHVRYDADGNRHVFKTTANDGTYNVTRSGIVTGSKYTSADLKNPDRIAKMRAELRAGTGSKKITQLKSNAKEEKKYGRGMVRKADGTHFNIVELKQEFPKQYKSRAEILRKNAAKRGFLGEVASESFEEGYVQALEDYGYFE